MQLDPYNARVLKTRLRYCYYMELTVKSLSNHVVLRKDKGYFYPHVKYIAYVANEDLYRPQIKLPELAKTTDELQFYYYYAHSMTINQQFQRRCKLQNVSSVDMN